MHLQAGFALKYLRIRYGQIYSILLLEVEKTLSGQLILVYFILLYMQSALWSILSI